MRHIVVLGAGVIGVTTAWQLQKAGFFVSVIDRQADVALETSFANGGQISVCHATPWANPKTPYRALRWLWQEDAPLLFRLRADKALWRWIWQFLIQCNEKHAYQNLVSMVNLGLYSRKILQQVRTETQIDYHCLTKGIMHFYTNQQEFNNARIPTQQMQQLGCDRQMITPKMAIQIEPALTDVMDKLVGATYTPSDESGDAKKFTQNLAQLCKKQGVEFLFHQQIRQLVMKNNQILSVELYDLQHQKMSSLQADGYVVALGCETALLLKNLGMNVPIYPAKGYSATYPVLDPIKTPMVSLIDDEFKLVYSRLGDRLRVAGTAEFNGFNQDLNPLRCQAITRRVSEVFTNAVNLKQPNYWTGLRPMTPSNVPIIGQAVNRYGKIHRLFVNSGHGTLGWTHANGSAKLISQIISKQPPDIDFPFVGA